jgi:hypothetical protein
MGSYLLAVWSSAKPGRDDDYNAWYEGVHLADICAVPGVISGRRYQAIPASPATPDGAYLGLFEIEVDDPTGVLAEIDRRGKSGEMKFSDSIDGASVKMLLLERRV